TDYKSIYIQSNEDILSNKYIPQVDINKDDVAYEIRRFLELVSTGNPNVLELLYLPERCIIETSPEWEYILKYREKFLTKKCHSTYFEYAKTQLVKASGLNKKYKWDKDRITRKDILDFCTVTDRYDGRTNKFKEWTKVDQKWLGLTSIEGFRDCYKVYLGKEYKGIIEKDSNEPKKSIVEKEEIDNWLGILYWNRENYSTHCKEYREFKQWEEKRNPNRYLTNKDHGQDLDSKNIMHLVRLI